MPSPGSATPPASIIFRYPACGLESSRIAAMAAAWISSRSLLTCAFLSSSCQQHAPGDGAAAVGHNRHLGVSADLALPRLPPPLQARFVQHPVAVHPPTRELPAVGVEREVAVPGDALGAVDERS